MLKKRMNRSPVKNVGSEAVENLRMSYQPRLDFAVTRAPEIPTRLGPGEGVEICGEVRAPLPVNLTSEYNRVSYAQWSAAFERAGKARFAHAWARIVLE